jgi:hypothetical protein
MTFAIRVERVSSHAADIAIGETGASGMPDEFVVVDGADAPFMRIAVYRPADEYHLRTEALAWGGWIAVGFASRVVLISIDDRSQRTIALSDGLPPMFADYFCQLHACPGRLLVCSGRRLLRVDLDGSVAWTSNELGVDGVLVHSVVDGVVSGAGEWDPPGGWLPFAISLQSGTAV